MPLNIKVDNPSAYAGAVLQYVPTQAELIEAIPGLVGAWNASTLAQSAPVAAWPAQYGTGIASQSITARQPTAGMADDRPVIRNGAMSKNIVVDHTFTPGAVLTAGARFKIEDTAQDFQAVFGANAVGTNAWRLLYRIAGNFQFDITSDLNAAGAATPGWHTVLVMQSADTTRMLIDGVLFTGANVPVAVTQMIIGASSNTGTANSFLGAISKFLVAEADIYGTEHQATALAFLNS